MGLDGSIYVAGHRGLVGSAICRELNSNGYTNIITKTRAELDLRIQKDVDAFFMEEQPKYVFLAAACVGGIQANINNPAQFITDNLLIQTNVISASYLYGVEKLLFLGSSCIYPRITEQPITENQLLAGYLEPTNEAYAIAKIAGIIMCQSYAKEYGMRAISLMPTNLYGPGDNFDLENSHVVPALIRKFHEAEPGSDVEIWGTGNPRREFLYVDDLASACVFLMNNYESTEPINVGTGEDMKISELAELIKKVTGFDGNIVYNKSKPDGIHQKLLDVTKLTELGWSYRIDLEEGLRNTYNWYRANC